MYMANLRSTHSDYHDNRRVRTWNYREKHCAACSVYNYMVWIQVHKATEHFLPRSC